MKMELIKKTEGLEMTVYRRRKGFLRETPLDRGGRGMVLLHSVKYPCSFVSGGAIRP